MSCLRVGRGTAWVDDAAAVLQRRTATCEAADGGQSDDHRPCGVSDTAGGGLGAGCASPTTLLALRSRSSHSRRALLTSLAMADIADLRHPHRLESLSTDSPTSSAP